MRRKLIVLLLSLGAWPAAAQDISSPYDSAVSDFGQRQLHDTLAKRRIEQAQRRQRGQRPLSAKSQAICRNKHAMAAKVTPAQGRRLIALCTRAGF